ncbi:MAG: CPBP family intramembrane glutamic endopeptidase [Bacteroidota bacterium]
MANHLAPTPIENKFLSLAGVTASCYAIVWLSPLSFFCRFFAVEQYYFFLQFERHFWLYTFAFIAIVVLSRGHLWSYGVNSQNLKTSIAWLVWLYGVVMVATVTAAAFGAEFLPVEPDNIPGGNGEIIMASLVYWMSSPVANQILFFGFGQTILMKQWGERPAIAGIPLSVFFSAILFTTGATTSQFFIGDFSFLPTFLLGMFCGIVYWKTNSLITPMLGHAFYFGFPLFFHLLRNVNTIHP